MLRATVRQFRTEEPNRPSPNSHASYAVGPEEPCAILGNGVPCGGVVSSLACFLLLQSTSLSVQPQCLAPVNSPSRTSLPDLPFESANPLLLLRHASPDWNGPLKGVSLLYHRMCCANAPRWHTLPMARIGSARHIAGRCSIEFRGVLRAPIHFLYRLDTLRIPGRNVCITASGPAQAPY